MATMQGITGKLSGKMGSAVFRVRNGQQVVTQYNPIVANPNTEGQQGARSTFKLMSQLAAVMAPGMGSFIIKTRPQGGKQTKRNAFFQANYGLVTTETTAEGAVAKIPLEEIQLTSSFRDLGSIEAQAAAGGAVSVEVQTNLKQGDEVVFNVIRNDAEKAPVLLQTTRTPVDTDGVADLQLSDLPAGDYTILAFGTIVTEEAVGRISLDSIHGDSVAPNYAAIKLDKAVSDGYVVETKTIGVNVNVAS